MRNQPFMKLDKEFWSDRYQGKQTGWDIGYPSTPLQTYFDQLTNKNQKILIPGCGNAYEASYLCKQGFTNVYVLDIAEEPLLQFKRNNPNFPENQLVQKDFFDHSDTYDLIIEQTFFCALHPSKRINYAKHMSSLLNSGGKLAGVLFSTIFNLDGPPFGGNKQEYEMLFSIDFKIKTLENCYNSILPRRGNELFFYL